MDSGRPRDDRDGRVPRGRGERYVRPFPSSLSHRPTRFSREHSPPGPPRLAYQQIPLRPAHPQRFPDASPLHVQAHPHTQYWRPDAASLPARPVQRYRSPPPVQPNPSLRTWDARPRDRDGARGWVRDEFPPGRGEARPNGYRGEGEGEPGWPERESRDRRPYQDSSRRNFDIPHRPQPKRPRDSSDDDDTYAAARPRSRPDSPEWRSRNPIPGARPDQRRSSEGKALFPSRPDERLKRPPSPAASDRSPYEAVVKGHDSADSRERERSSRRRSYSPGEISDGLTRSLSPVSRSHSVSLPPQPGARLRSATRTPPGSPRRSGTPPRPRAMPPVVAGSLLQRMSVVPTYTNGTTKMEETRPTVHGGTPPIQDRMDRSPPRPAIVLPRRVSPETLRSSPAPRTSAPVVERRSPPQPSPLPPPRDSPPQPDCTTTQSFPPSPPTALETHTPPLPERLLVATAPTAVVVSLSDVLLVHAKLPVDLDPQQRPSPPISPPRGLPICSAPLVTPAPESGTPPLPVRRLSYDPPPALLERPSSPPLLPLLSPPHSPLPSAVHSLDPDTSMTVLQPSPSTLSPPSSVQHPPLGPETFLIPLDSSKVRLVNADALVEMDIDGAVDASERTRDHHAMEVDDTTRSPTPNPCEPMVSSPPPPPRDFAFVLDLVIAAHEVDSGEVNELMLSNRARTAGEREAKVVIRDVTNREPLSVNRLSHDRLMPFLLDDFAARDARRGDKTVALRTQYKALNDDWRAHCRRLDRVKDRVHRRHHQPTTVPSTPYIDPSGLLVYPEPSAVGPSVTIGRTNRRNANSSFGYGDAVRSEAEFLEILASLETADMRDPNVRATRTAAVVPDMVVDESERRDLLAFEDDRRMVVDPVDFYALGAPLDLWTEDEVQTFCKRFSQHPKQFGRIAADLPEKTTAQCVLFYYRMKTTIDFRSLSDRRGRDGRRRKTRRRVDAEGTAKKGASLLSNLKRVRADDRDDEDDSPPPSPQTLRRSIGESPSVFQPPGATSRPAAVEDYDMYDDEPRRPGTGNKKSRTPKPREVHLPSDGMLEAAQALGALAGFAGDEDDEDEDGKARKRKLDFDLMDAKDRTAAARRKSASSSYWSVAERNKFIQILALHGKDWTRLAEGLENKTAVQCRNWFQNHSKKLNLGEIAKNAGGRFAEGAEEDLGPVDTVPATEYTAPLGVPLSESFGPNGSAVPQAGFFVPDAAHRILSPRPVNATHLPVPGAPLPEAPSTKVAMPIHNLLNDDVPDKAVPVPAGDDWFGGAAAEETEMEEGEMRDDGGSATTDDESAQRPSTGRRLSDREYEAAPAVQRNESYPPLSFASNRQYPKGTSDSPASTATAYRSPQAAPYASSTPYSATNRDRRFDSPIRPPNLPSLSTAWQSSPPVAHQFPPYGPPGTTAPLVNRPRALSNDFRRPGETNGAGSNGLYPIPSHLPQRSYFAPLQAKTASTIYDRNFNRFPPAPSGSGYPDASQQRINAPPHRWSPNPPGR